MSENYSSAEQHEWMMERVGEVWFSCVSCSSFGRLPVVVAVVVVHCCFVYVGSSVVQAFVSFC